MSTLNKENKAGRNREHEKMLTALLGLDGRPVAVRFIKTEEEYKALDLHEPKTGLPYCTAVSMARKGKSFKLDAKHNRCGASSIAFGMIPLNEYRSSGKMHADLKVYDSVEVSRQVAEDMVYCSEKNYGVAVEPLGESDSEPDIVIIIGKPKQAMRILQGYAYHNGQLKNIKMAGMCAICQECTSYPFVKGQINISMLCSGTRCVGSWAEDEMGIGIPGSLAESLTDGILNTVDPMENKASKLQIEDRMKKAGLNTPEFDLKNNYYSHAYGIPKQE